VISQNFLVTDNTTKLKRPLFFLSSSQLRDQEVHIFTKSGIMIRWSPSTILKLKRKTSRNFPQRSDRAIVAPPRHIVHYETELRSLAENSTNTSSLFSLFFAQIQMKSQILSIREWSSGELGKKWALFLAKFRPYLRFFRAKIFAVLGAIFVWLLRKNRAIFGGDWRKYLWSAP